VDTEPLYFKATAEILSRFGVELSCALYHELFLVQSRGAWHLAVERGLPAERVESLRAERNERYERLLEGSDLAVPGAREALARLHGRVAMGVVTSSLRRHFDAIHRGSGLRPYFDFVLTREDYRHSKPDPEPFQKALEVAGVGANEALVVEDSQRGLTAAKAAGLPCWIVRTGLTRATDFSLADRVLDSVAEVASLLLGANR
jgi:HAD superfamily hydrolase (TIGR01509 family)